MGILRIFGVLVGSLFGALFGAVLCIALLWGFVYLCFGGVL
jgi:hypothetical protein